MEAQVVIPEKLWIVTDKHGKVGTLRACEAGYEFFDNRTSQKQILDSFDQFQEASKQEVETSDLFHVNGFPTRFKTGVIVENDDLPLFKKTETSNTIQAAGFFCVKTEKVGWGGWSCPTLKTLAKNDWRGPFRSEWEMNLELAKLKN